jgi:hypothetical protein
MVKSISAMALAKGATASTSTLTLIKGALKIRIFREFHGCQSGGI